MTNTDTAAATAAARHAAEVAALQFAPITRPARRTGKVRTARRSTRRIIR